MNDAVSQLSLNLSGHFFLSLVILNCYWEVDWKAEVWDKKVGDEDELTDREADVRSKRRH